MTYTWTIDPDRTDGGIVANSMDGDMPEYVRGKRLTLTFAFWDESGIATDHVTRYEQARQYLDYAGAISVNQSINGVPHYRERLPGSAAVDSLVIKVTSGSSETATPDLWVAITGGDDPSAYVDDIARVEYQTTVLAEGSEFADRDAIEAARSGSVI